MLHQDIIFQIILIKSNNTKILYVYIFSSLKFYNPFKLLKENIYTANYQSKSKK